MRWLLPLLLLACQFRRQPPAQDSDGGDGGGAGGGAADDSGSTTDRVPVALVADGGNQRFVYIRLDTGDILYEIPLREHFPEYCIEGYDCVAFGSEPSLDPVTGDDRALLIASVSEYSGASPYTPSFVAMERLTVDGPVVDWSLSELDFTKNYGDRPDICDQAEPCVAPAPEVKGNVNWRNCTFQNTHTAVIVDETADRVTLWLADTGKPSRALLVTMDKASTCGVVDQVLGSDTTDDWTDESGPNDLDVVTIDGQERLLLNHLASSGFEARGRVTVWKEEAGQWSLDWIHPVDGDRLQGGHEADVVDAADGRQYLVYAHGNGAGANDDINDWDTELDHRGSVGIVRITDDQPEYLLDAVVADQGFSFLRDADLLDDGSFLVTDSGCMNHYFPGCERESLLWHVDIDFTDATPTGRSGAYSEDHAQQDFVAATPTDAVFPSRTTCGFLTPYEADLVWDDELGPFLSSRLDQPAGSCADE